MNPENQTLYNNLSSLKTQLGSLSGAQKTNFENSAASNTIQQGLSGLSTSLGGATGPNVSTTTLSNINKQKVVPKLIGQLNSYSDNGVRTDANGNTTYADGTAAPDYSNFDASTANESDQINKNLDDMKSSLDASTKQQIDAIQSQYSIRKQQQADINTRTAAQYNNALLMGGVTGQGSSAQYAPISSAGIMSAQESFGLQKISELDAQEQGLIAQARSAQNDGNYKLMESKNTLIKDIRDKKLAQAVEVQNSIQKRNDELKKEQEQVAKDQVVSEMVQKGVKTMPEIMAELKNRGMTATAADVAESLGKIDKKPETDFLNLGNGNYVMVDKTTGRIIKSYGAGTGNTGTPSTAVLTVQTDKGATPVTGYKLQIGDDPYLIAQQNGTNMDMLSKLNPQISDWHNLPVGTVLNLPNNDEKWLEGRTPTQVQAYNKLDDGDKDIIKQLVNGDALLTDIVKSRGKDTTAQIKDVIAKATAVDPSFSINNNKIKFNANQKWNDTNGKQFIQRGAINTAIAHMATTYEAAKSLGNEDVPKYNDIANWASKNTGNPQLTNFVYDLTALAGEIASAYKGGGAPTDTETEKFYNALSGSMSPEQFKGAFTQSSKLLSGKLRSLAQEYKNTTGKYPTSPIIQPAALEDIKKSGIDTSEMEKILKDQGYDMPENLDPLNIGVQSKTSQNKDPLGLGI